MQGARAPQPGATNRPSPSGPFYVPSAPDRSQDTHFLERCAAPRAPWSATRPQQPAPQRPPGAGGHGGRGTPGPIPNPEVKPASAEGTAGATLWETRAPPAPGARCAGLGAVRRDMSTWERGTRGGPPLSYAGPLSTYRSGLLPFFFSRGAISTPQGRWNGCGHSPSRRIEGSPCQRPFPFKGRSSFF